MGSDKCDKCGVNKYCWYMPSYVNPDYQVCGKCHDEWLDNDYYKMWHTLIDADSFDLADKFVLDFLGKLG